MSGSPLNFSAKALTSSTVIRFGSLMTCAPPDIARRIDKAIPAFLPKLASRAALNVLFRVIEDGSPNRTISWLVYSAAFDLAAWGFTFGLFRDLLPDVASETQNKLKTTQSKNTLNNTDNSDFDLFMTSHPANKQRFL
jgi:hypothetical protein